MSAYEGVCDDAVHARIATPDPFHGIQVRRSELPAQEPATK
jgi:hypothetical protein